jgi:hypothetical protein
MADENAQFERIAELERLLKAAEADKQAAQAAAEAAQAAAEADKQKQQAKDFKIAELEQQVIELKYEIFCDERRRMCHLFSHGGSCSSSHGLIWPLP